MRSKGIKFICAILYVLFALYTTQYIINRYGEDDLLCMALGLLYGALFLSTIMAGVLNFIIPNNEHRMENITKNIFSVTGVLGIMTAVAYYFICGMDTLVEKTILYAYVSVVLSPLVYFLISPIYRKNGGV